MHNEWAGVWDSYPYVHGIFLSYAQFSVFDAEYRYAQCCGGFTADNIDSRNAGSHKLCFLSSEWGTLFIVIKLSELENRFRM